MAIQATVTEMLSAARRGEVGALDGVFTVLYPELRRIARAKMRQTDQRISLDTTSLVHECYLKLVQVNQLEPASRAHFLAYSARAMRSVVVDIARESQALRRGGDQVFVTLNTAASNVLASEDDDVLAIHEALQELSDIEPRLVKVVEMRYFVGLDNSEVAQALGVTERTVQRDWERARSFLYASLKGR